MYMSERLLGGAAFRRRPYFFIFVWKSLHQLTEMEGRTHGSKTGVSQFVSQFALKSCY